MTPFFKILGNLMCFLFLPVSCFQRAPYIIFHIHQNWSSPCVYVKLGLFKEAPGDEHERLKPMIKGRE